jgi:hypothetical protein
VLTTLPPLCADCLEILAASTSWRPNWPAQACTGKALSLPYGGVVGNSNVLDVVLCCQVPLNQRQNVTSQKTEIKLMAVAKLNNLCEILCWNVNGCVINLIWRLSVRT